MVNRPINSVRLPFRATPFRHLVLVALSALSGVSALAMQLGDLQVKSSLGAPFSAVIPVKLKEDEQLDAACIRLVPDGKQDATYIRQANINVERGRSGSQISISTKYRLNEPLVRIALVINCAGANSVGRDYPVLLDPPAVAVSETNQISVKPAPSKAPKLSGKPLVVGSGDSLSSIANRLFPGDADAQASFVRKMLARYPDVGGPDEVLETGRQLYLVKVRPSVSAVAAPAAPKVQPKEVAKKSPVQASPSLPAKTPVENLVPGDRLELSGGASGPESSLKLSYSLAPSAKNLSPAEKEALKQKLKLINSDDQLAYLIDLQNQLKQVHQEMNAIKQRPVDNPSQAVEADLPAETSSWLAENGMLYGGAGLLVALLIGGGLYYRKRREAAAWSFDDYVPPASQGAAALVGSGLVDQSVVDTGSAPAVVDEEAAPDFGQDMGRSGAILVEESERWAVEEAQVFLAHGWVDHAVSLLKEEIDKNQYHLDLWIMLFDVYKQNQMVEAFEELAKSFKEIAFGLPIWDQVMAMQSELQAAVSQQHQSAEDAAALDAALDLDLAAGDAASDPVPQQVAEVAPEPASLEALPFEAVWLADDEPVADKETQDAAEDKMEETDVFNSVLLPADDPEELVAEPVVAEADDKIDFDLAELSLAPIEAREVTPSADGQASEAEIDFSNIDFDLTLDLTPDELDSSKKHS